MLCRGIVPAHVAPRLTETHRRHRDHASTAEAGTPPPRSAASKRCAGSSTGRRARPGRANTDSRAMTSRCRPSSSLLFPGDRTGRWMNSRFRETWAAIEASRLRRCGVSRRSSHAAGSASCLARRRAHARPRPKKAAGRDDCDPHEMPSPKQERLHRMASGTCDPSAVSSLHRAPSRHHARRRGALHLSRRDPLRVSGGLVPKATPTTT